MRRFLMSAAAVSLGLALTSAAHAGGHGHSGPHPSSGKSMNSSFFKGNGSFTKGVQGPGSKYNFKFQKGYDFHGQCHQWSRYCWSGRYGCYCYYCPTDCCWYYWDEPRCCFYPVVYLTSPCVTAQPAAQPAPVAAPPALAGAAVTATASATAAVGAGPAGPPAP